MATLGWFGDILGICLAVGSSDLSLKMVLISVLGLKCCLHSGGDPFGLLAYLDISPMGILGVTLFLVLAPATIHFPGQCKKTWLPGTPVVTIKKTLKNC